MRLGTKILILTLTITLALAGIIVWVVTRDLTRHETDRARADISRAAAGYFEGIQSLHADEYERVSLIMDDPQNGARLEALESADEATREHFKYIFGEVLNRARSGGWSGDEGTLPSSHPVAEADAPADAIRPAFHVVLDFEGRPLLLFSPGDERVADALAAAAVEWPVESLLADEPVLSQKYVWIDRGGGGELYLALGFPLKLEATGAPTHAYFAGHRVDDAWARWLLGPAFRLARGLPVPASEARVVAGADTPIVAWFVVDGAVIARAASSADDEASPATVSGIGARAVAAHPPPAGLHSHIEFSVGDERFVGEAVGFDLPDGRRGALTLASSLTRALAPLRHLQATIAWVTAGVIVVAIVAFRLVSNLIARPVGQLVAGTQRVARGEFDEPIVVDRRDELGELARSFNEMAVGLQQRDLVKSTFGRFVDPRIVEGFLTNPERLMPGGDKRVQTILFSDLQSFTSISERLDADDLVALLNGYLGDAADVVTATRGIVDKFIGDAVVAFWGPPITAEHEHAALACRAAVRMVAGARRQDERCRDLGVPPLGVRVGVATGEVLVGLIGSSNKYDYTVMGDTANLGSRLEGLNKLYGTNILVTARTAREAGDAVVTRRIDTVRVVGRAEPVELYEVLAERDGGEDAPERGTNGDVNVGLALRCEAFAEAAARYEKRDWTGAAGSFARVCSEWPEDQAARAMAERCAGFQREDPGSQWDGVWMATAK